MFSRKKREPSFYQDLCRPSLHSELRGGIALSWDIRRRAPVPEVQWMLSLEPCLSPGTVPTFSRCSAVACPHVRQAISLACDASSGRTPPGSSTWTERWQRSCSSSALSFLGPSVPNPRFPRAERERHPAIASARTAQTSSLQPTSCCPPPCPELEPPAERPSAVAHASVQAPRAARVQAAEGARAAGRSAWTRASTVPPSPSDGGAPPTCPVARLRSAGAGTSRVDVADATFP